MADVDDRWHRIDKATGEKVRTGRYGKSPDKRYAARYRDRGGKQRSPGFRTKTEAEDHLAKVRTEMKERTFLDPALGKITLTDYSVLWFDGYAPRSASSREAVERRLRLHIRPGLGHHSLATLAANPELITAWLAKLPLSDVRPVKTLLSQILRASKENGRISRNPCDLRSVQSARPAPTRARVIPWRTDEIERLLDALPERYRPIAVLAVGAGLRVGEIRGLALEDVDWFRDVLHVRRQVKRVDGAEVFDLPKYGKQRDVPLPEWSKLALAASLKVRPAAPVTLPWAVPGGTETTANLVFTAEEGGRVNGRMLGHTWTAARTAAGIDYGHGRNGIHQLRHTFASVQLAEGTDIRALSEYLGHADPGFTLRTYTHLMPKAADRARAAIDRVFGHSAPDVRPASSQGR